MSNRASTSRLSLEDWDLTASLSPAESASVAKVQLKADERAIPLRLQAKPASSSRPSTPILRRGSHANLNGLPHSPNHSPRPASRAGPLVGAGAGGAATPQLGPLNGLLDLASPVETAQQFHDWFARVEQSMEREQEEIYRTHLHEIEQYILSCDDVLEQLDDSRGLLSEMEANYRFVEDNSRALQLACENMLDEQVRGLSHSRE